MKTETQLYNEMAAAKYEYFKAKKAYHLHNRNVVGNFSSCYWTRPFGHIYNKEGFCVFCNKYNWSVE
jgi:hypothetical protein